MRLCQDLPSRLCRLLFILTLLLAWCQGPSLRAQTTGDAGVGTGVGTGREPTADDFKDFVVRFEKFLDAVEKADGELPRDSFDLASVVAEAGKDPQALLAWVRDHTAWVPYAGALRGAAGTLMDRVGNSLDRALCLAELLRAAGHSARLATATLTDEQARALRGRLAAEGARASTREQTAADATAWDRAIEQEAAQQGLDPQQFRRDVEKLVAPVNKMAEQLAQRVAEQVPALTQALEVGAQPGARRITEDPAERELTALRDHWWVQLRQGGSWVDLDPMPPEVQNGLRPAKTVDLAKDPGKLPLAAAECHEVTITVVAEQWKDGKLREAPALKHTFRPAELLGQRVVLSHVPLDWPGDLNLASAAAPAARVEELMLGQREWVPMLQVGETTVIQSGVTTAGAIDPKPALDAMAKIGAGTAGAAKRVTSLFENLPGGDRGAAKKADDGGVWTAEWIEYEVRSPGREPVIARRQVFDLLGPAARDSAAAGGAASTPAPAVDDPRKLDRALALFGAAEIVALPCRPTAPFIQHVLDVNLLSHRPALREALKAGVAGDAPAGANKLMSMAPMPAAPYLFAVARSDWSRVRDQTYLDRPNVIAYHRRLAVAGPTGLVKRVVFDIVVNAVQVRPGQAAAFDRFLARLEQGIVDSNLEALLAPENVPAVSAADLYRRSASQGVQWATLRGGAGGAQPDWGQVNLPEDARARIAKDLAAGCVAVVPVKPVEINGRPSVGWWRVDPKTGDALAMTEGGGSTATEYSLLVRLSVAAAVGMWTFIGCGGAAPGAGGFKVLGCAVCAAVAAVIVMFAFAGAAAGAGAKGLVGFMAGSNGVVAGAGVSISCNAISGLMS